MPIYSFESIKASRIFTSNFTKIAKLSAYEVEDAVLKNYQEFAIANHLYWAIAEGYASEVSARRTAMENATKNAGEMIQKLTLVYNRSRQASITNDLVYVYLF
jgi:F-type H+-transporting ATPase subunit gamma